MYPIAFSKDQPTNRSIMSLATSGGMGMGGGAGASGGLVMAHQTVGPAAPPQPPPVQSTGHAAPPPSAAALGADLLDKNQSLTTKTVRNVSHLPITAVDLFGTHAHVALFPKKPEDPSKGDVPLSVSELPQDVILKSSEQAHKTFKKYLSKSKSYATLRSECIAAGTAKKKSEGQVILEKPYRWLGLRRCQDAPDFLREMVPIHETKEQAIAEEASSGIGAILENSTLDGSAPLNDDYDRVIYKIRLHESKKAVPVLPEEAVQILLHEAQYRTAAKVGANLDEDEEEEITEYPLALAVPAYSLHDAAVEALMDARDAASVVIFQRNVCAVAGALLPRLDGQVTPILQRINTVRAAQHKEYQRRLVKDPEALLEDEIVFLVWSVTYDGFEATGIQISSANLHNISCLFGDFKVITNVSYQTKSPISEMEKFIKELEAAMDLNAPDADGPAGIIVCGSNQEQKEILAQWDKIKGSQKEWGKVPLFTTDTDCVSKGAAVLGAVSHGRLSKVSHGGKKSRAELGIRVQNVAPCAVGIRMNYHGGAPDRWAAVKPIFDFDRQIPAGPHAIDLNSAECAVYRSGKGDSLSEDEFLKAVKENEGSRGIPKREEAALNFQIQILQKWTRDGEWKKVGDPMEPLVKKSEKDKKEERIGCESVVLELSLGVTGMITSNLVGERYVATVVTDVMFASS